MVDRGEIKSLTGLRGVAALFVVTYHYFEGSKITGAAGIFLRHGYIAVDLFFVLSGFVMSLNYASDFAGDFSGHTYLQFLYRRLARVYPLYICMTLATAIVEARAFPAYEWTTNALMIQGVTLSESIMGTSWSISVELIAYLLFPVFVWAALTPKVLRAWTSGMIACMTLALVAWQSPAALHQVFQGVPSKNGPLDVAVTTTFYPLLRCMAGFMLGMLAFRLARLPRSVALASRRGAALLVVAAVLVTIALPGDDIALVLLFVPLVIVLAVRSSPVARLLSRPAFHWLGLVSYSIYLTHRLVQSLLLLPLDNALLPAHVPHAYSVATVLLLVATVAASAATYYGIERPARDLARRLIQHRPPPIEAEPSAP